MHLFKQYNQKIQLKKQLLLKSPMQPRMSLQISNFNFEKNIFCKSKTKIALPYKYYMYFPDNPEVIYILVSIKICIGNDLDKGHYLCDILD